MGWKEVGSGLERGREWVGKRRESVGKRLGVGWKEVGSGLERGRGWVGSQAGQGRAGQGRAGQGRAQGRAGRRAGQGRAGAFHVTPAPLFQLWVWCVW